MKAIEEQISSRCKHFNGVMNTHCKAGVKYEDVRVDKPYKFPCLKQGGECLKCEFPSIEDIEKEMQELNDLTKRSISAMVKIKELYKSTRESTGKAPCDCGGELNYVIAECNQHVAGFCKNCKLSIRE